MDVPSRFVSVRTLLIAVLAALAVSGSAQAMPANDDTICVFFTDGVLVLPSGERHELTPIFFCSATLEPR
jgi:hypothetical protein